MTNHPNRNKHFIICVGTQHYSGPHKTRAEAEQALAFAKQNVKTTASIYIRAIAQRGYYPDWGTAI